MAVSKNAYGYVSYFHFVLIESQRYSPRLWGDDVLNNEMKSAQLSFLMNYTLIYCYWSLSVGSRNTLAALRIFGTFDRLYGSRSRLSEISVLGASHQLALMKNRNSSIHIFTTENELTIFFPGFCHVCTL